MEYIVEQLRSLAVGVGEVISDPANARKHPEDNLEGIKASLRVYGQRKPIVVNRRNNVVEAGNGTLQAAIALGWTHIAVVYVDDDPMMAAGFAIADNRTAELAEWDKDALDKLLREVQTDDAEMASLLSKLAEEEGIIPTEAEEKQDVGPQLAGLEHRIIVECDNEEHQAELLGKFETEGYRCRALIS